MVVLQKRTFRRVLKQIYGIEEGNKETVVSSQRGVLVVEVVVRGEVKRKAKVR